MAHGARDTSGLATKLMAAALALAAVVYAVRPPASGLQGTAVAATLGSVLPSATPERAPVAAASTDLGAATPAAPGEIMRIALDVTAAAPHRLQLRVTNSGRKLAELRFPDGQTHEFVVHDAAGREVWRWSAGRMFTQAMRTRAIDGGETIVFDEAWPAELATGQYTVTGQLKSDNHPLEARRAVTLP